MLEDCARALLLPSASPGEWNYLVLEPARSWRMEQWQTGVEMPWKMPPNPWQNNRS